MTACRSPLTEAFVAQHVRQHDAGCYAVRHTGCAAKSMTHPVTGARFDFSRGPAPGLTAKLPSYSPGEPEGRLANRNTFCKEVINSRAA